MNTGRRIVAPAVLGAWILLAAGCSGVTTVERNGDTPDDLNPFDRRVDYEVDLALLLGDVRRICIGTVAVPGDMTLDPALRVAISRSLLERAKLHFEDLGIEVAARGADDDALDATLAGCTHLLTATVVTHDEFYTLFWSRRRIGLEIDLVALADQRTMWTASHTGSRNEMSVPTDPVGLVVAVFKSQDFAGDAEVMPSLIDDVVRRLFATFPAPQPAAGQGAPPSTIRVAPVT